MGMSLEGSETDACSKEMENKLTEPEVQSQGGVDVVPFI